mgnify:CR=1 FL=1
MKVLLCCAGGLSSSILMKKMKTWADAHGEDLEIQAMGTGEAVETWQNGAPVLHPSGNPKVKINLNIADDLNPQVFWPWRESEIVNLFDSCPPGTYCMEVWDVYKDGVFQRTEYQIHVI